jgi:hypothetical protein
MLLWPYPSIEIYGRGKSRPFGITWCAQDQLGEVVFFDRHLDQAVLGLLRVLRRRPVARSTARFGAARHERILERQSA